MKPDKPHEAFGKVKCPALAVAIAFDLLRRRVSKIACITHLGFKYAGVRGFYSGHRLGSLRIETCCEE